MKSNAVVYDPIDSGTPDWRFAEFGRYTPALLAVSNFGNPNSITNTWMGKTTACWFNGHKPVAVWLI